MPKNTPNLNLYKKDPQTDGDDTFNIETMLNENFDKIDAAVGDRTINDSATPTGNTGSITTLLSWLANMIKSITGKSSWRTAPATTLEAAKTHADDIVRHITEAERTAWNTKETPEGAQSKADAAREAAINAAAQDASNKANGARDAAISAAATDASNKSAGAQTAAIAAAASDASGKANAAQSAAISAAATDATNKANTAREAAISTAAADATNKANAAREAAKAASIPIGQKGAADGVAVLDDQQFVAAKGLKLTESYKQQVLKFNISNGTPNQKVNLRFTQAAGFFEITIASTFAYQNAMGKITKRFNGIYSPEGHIHEAYSRYTEVTGHLKYNISIGDPVWDTSGYWKIPIEARNTAGNPFTVLFTSLSGGDATVASLSEVYTGAATTLPLAVQVIPDNTETENGFKIWHSGNGGAGSGLDADMVDGVHLANIALTNGYTDFGGNANSITTSQFLNLLESKGAFNSGHWVARASWAYALNQTIVDSGFGLISLAGCVIEVTGSEVGLCTVKIITPPQSNVDPGTTWSEFIYVSQPTGYESGWRKQWNSANMGVGSGLDADLHAGKTLTEVVQGTLAYAVTTGTGTGYAANLTPKVAFLTPGLRLTIKAHAASAGPITLTVNGLEPKPIKKPNGNNPPLAYGGVYTLVYDGSAFILQGEGGEYGTATAAHVLNTQTFGTEWGISQGEMPLKTVGNGDGQWGNHHMARRTSAEPGTIYLAPVDEYGPAVAYQGEVWIRKDDPNFNPAYWRDDVTMFGLQGAMPVRGGEIYPGWRLATVGQPSVPTRLHLKIPLGAYVTGTPDQGGDMGVYIDSSAFNPAFWRSDVNMFGLQGQMPVRGAVVLTPGTSNVPISEGHHNGGGYVQGDPDLTGANILRGKNIFGVNGTALRRASGNLYTSNGVINVTGLEFTPRLVHIKTLLTGDNRMYTMATGLRGYDKAIWSCIRHDGNYSPFDSTQFHGPDFFAGGFNVTIPNIYSQEYMTWEAYE